jgi:RNA polymerase sigma-70 factor (ECF subfamily)
VRKRKWRGVNSPQNVSNSLPVEESGDAVLIRRFLQSGETVIFRALVERHLPSIRRVLYTLFNGQKEEMEDAEQEIILVLFQRLKDFQFRSSFRTYFYSLARNKAVDLLRGRRSRQRALARFRMGMWNRPDPDPEEQILEREERETLLAAFQILPVRERQLIMMKDIEGFSLAEMAQILKVPLGTVKSGLHRAREKFAGIVRDKR